MVRAILAGTKMQTRRVVKPQPKPCDHSYAPELGAASQWMRDDKGDWYCATCGNGIELAHHIKEGVRGMRCPYGQPGDRLWVRENWRRLDQDNVVGVHVQYESDGARLWIKEGVRIPDGYRPDRVVPSIHMPRWASRITLEVTGVRVERLQDISEEDARAEGVSPFPNDPDGDCWTDGKHKTAFNYLWNEIHGWCPNSWDANPYVWCVSFKRVEATP